MNKAKEIIFLQNLPRVDKKTIFTKYWDTLSVSNDCESLKNEIEKHFVDFSLKELDDAYCEMLNIINEVNAYNENCDSCIKLITIFDEEYPKKLNVMGDNKPLLLYVKGDEKILNKNAVSVIGTRKPSAASMDAEKQLVKDILNLTDYVEVSGLALGCDQIGHDATINERRETIAALPCGINNITPDEKNELAKKIVESGGCLISEYPINIVTSRIGYLERDAIIAAMSDIVFVVECKIRSGTMHTVNWGIKDNVPICCYKPKNINNDEYEGNKYIIDTNMGVPISDKCELIETLAKFKDNKKI